MYRRKEEANKAGDGSFGGQWKNKGEKQSSRSISEMNGSYTDDKLNFALI